MRLIVLKATLLSATLCFISVFSLGQNSLLVNLGSNSCSSPVPSYAIIGTPLTANPIVHSNCNFSAQVPDFYNVFIAYNPRNNKIYIADVRSGVRTDIWMLDAGLPGNISCPTSIPVMPTYSYSYIANNFEFDNNGNLWAFSNYNQLTGECNIDNFDVNTGNILSSKTLRFRAGNFPTFIGSGDLTILPNGRLFACLGVNPCQLYEITDYNNSAPAATANFLQITPKPCYGIAYLNGSLELTGMGSTGCYYYDYDIANNILGAEKTFQNGFLPIDNTSFTPTVGVTKKLLSAVKLNASTADLTYEIYGENMGNTIINNLGITDNLVNAFGAGNVSNVSVSFVAGANMAGLTLNPFFNGTSNTQLLTAGQQLPNKILTNQNYFFKIRVSCRVSNLNNAITYLNSAVITGEIGNKLAGTLSAVSDSSNNGEPTSIDPNKNGNPSDFNENIPTPFVFGALPVKFLDFNVTMLYNNAVKLQWKIATPAENAARFEIEFSSDGEKFDNAGLIIINDLNQSNYQFIHNNIPAGSLLYRIKETDSDGIITYSKIAVLRRGSSQQQSIIYPNPASNALHIISAEGSRKKIVLLDITGRKVFEKITNNQRIEINTASFSNGTYLLEIKDELATSTLKVVVQH